MRIVYGLAVLGSLLALTPPGRAAGAAGFLYARVTTEDERVLVGRLRWHDEESFWGDFFDSTKRDRPYLDQVPREQRSQGKPIKIFGLTVGMHYDSDDERMLKVRFGDIAKLSPGDDDRATLLLKNGTEIDIDGGSNDVGATIRMWDDAGRETEIEWPRIKSIEFLASSPTLAPAARRLQGTVTTRAGEFRGFIQWDQHECLSSDKLDGESDGQTRAIEMGAIRRIARDSPKSARVTLRDGTELVLEGTNDVNDENRGIFVDDARYGRVLVPWDAFDRLEFSDPGGSGPAYGEFVAGRPLEGKVTERDGTVHAGRIVYDLDESESWEFLDGRARGVSYSIPLAGVRAIVPHEGGSRVFLRSGEELDLEEEADVSLGNDGIAVVGEGDRMAYVAWERVVRVEFD